MSDQGNLFDQPGSQVATITSVRETAEGIEYEGTATTSADDELRTPTSPTVGRHHRNPKRTELKAAKLVGPKAGTQRYRILEALVRAGDTGMTRWDLCSYLDMLMSSVCGRLDELKTKGHWATPIGRDRLNTVTNQSGEVWIATARGIRYIKGQQRGDA